MVDPVRKPGDNRVYSTQLFRLMNPELFIRHNRGTRILSLLGTGAFVAIMVNVMWGGDGAAEAHADRADSVGANTKDKTTT